MKTESERFFSDTVSTWQEAIALAAHTICRLSIWIAYGRTVWDRGLRACSGCPKRLDRWGLSIRLLLAAAEILLAIKVALNQRVRSGLTMRHF